MLTSVAMCAGAISAHSAEPTPVGSIGIRIAQVLALDTENPLAAAYIVSRLQPGIAHKQRLEIYNTSTQALKVDIYPGLANFVNEKFTVGNAREGNEFTSWIQLLPNAVTVKPNESKSIDMTITPPGDAASTQQFGVIWAEVQGAPNASGITSVSRVGIRIYVPIGNAPDITLSETSMTSSTNEIVVKKSFVSIYILEVIFFFIFLTLLFLFLFLFFFRRGSSDRKFRKENEKRLEAQWKQERARRRAIWDNRKNSRQFNSSNYDDQYEDENER